MADGHCATCTRALGAFAVRGNRSGAAFCDAHCGRAYNAHLIGADRAELVASRHLPPHFAVPRALAAAIAAHLDRIGTNGKRTLAQTEEQSESKRAVRAEPPSSSLSSSSSFSGAPSPLYATVPPTAATTATTTTLAAQGEPDEPPVYATPAVLHRAAPLLTLPPPPPPKKTHGARYESSELEEDLVRAFKRATALEHHDPRISAYAELSALGKFQAPEENEFLRFNESERSTLLINALQQIGFTAAELYKPDKSATTVTQMLEALVNLSANNGTASLLRDLSVTAFTPTQVLFAAVCGGPGAEFLVAQLLTSEEFSVRLLESVAPSRTYRMVLECAVRSIALVSPVLLEALLNEQWIRLAFRAQEYTTLLEESMRTLNPAVAKQCLESLNDLSVRTTAMRGSRLLETIVETVYIAPVGRMMRTTHANYVQCLSVLDSAHFLFFTDTAGGARRIDANIVLRFVEPRTLRDAEIAKLFYALLFGAFDIVIAENSTKDYVAQHLFAHPRQIALALRELSASRILSYVHAWYTRAEIYVYMEFLTRIHTQSGENYERMRALESYAFVLGELYWKNVGHEMPLDDILRRIDCMALRIMAQQGGTAMRRFAFVLLHSVLQRTQTSSLPYPQITTAALQLERFNEEGQIAITRYLMRSLCCTWTAQYEPDRRMLREIMQQLHQYDTRIQLRFYLRACVERHLELLHVVFELGTAEAKRVVLLHNHGLEMFIVQLCPWHAVITTADIAYLLGVLGNELDILADVFARHQFGMEYDSRGGFALYVYQVWNKALLTLLEQRGELRVFNVVQLFRNVYGYESAHRTGASDVSSAQRTMHKRTGISDVNRVERIRLERALDTMTQTPERLEPPLAENIIGFHWPLWVEEAWQPYKQ